MRSWTYRLTTVGLLGLFALSGCARPADPPQAGETVKPQLSEALKWKSGKPAKIGVRLQAQSADSAAPRLLDFNGIPNNVNPVADITFLDAAGKELSPAHVELSHRC
jgi:hypothetical protein